MRICEVVRRAAKIGARCSFIACVTISGVARGGDGSCCLPQMGCSEIITAADCVAQGGVYFPGVPCLADPCLGACCFGGDVCAQSDLFGCRNLGGTYSAFESCNDTQCPTAGACCTPAGGCFDAPDAATCDAQGGDFFLGQSCIDPPCPSAPTGACCSQGSAGQLCEESVTEPDCATRTESVFYAGLACDDIDCGPIGACCLTDGTCLDGQSQDHCFANDGAQFHSGMTCMDISCGCACELDGAVGVNVFDLLAYLAIWFPQNGMSGMGLSADYNNSGTVDVFDLLDFLSCWFPASSGGPCP